MHHNKIAFSGCMEFIYKSKKIGVLRCNNTLYVSFYVILQKSGNN